MRQSRVGNPRDSRDRDRGQPPEATEKPYCESCASSRLLLGLIMDKNYHIFSDGRIERSEDTVRLETDDGEKNISPSNTLRRFYLHGQIDYNTRLMSFLNNHGVAVHVFGWNDRYAGSLMPERGQTSGRTVVEQVRRTTILSNVSLSLPRSSVGVSTTCGRTSRTTTVGEYELGGVIEELDNATARIDDAGDISELMGVEATARRAYYQTFEAVLPDSFAFDGREYNPPPNPVNAPHFVRE